MQPANAVNGNGRGSATVSPLREKVSFPANLATIVRLDSAGELQEGRYGDQYRYFLEGGKIMWVEPAVHQLIQACGAREGDEVCITKREVKQGNRKGVRWDVELVAEEPPEAHQPAPAYHNPREAEADAEVRAAQRARALVEPPPPALAAEARSPHPNPLAQALIAAIDAVEAAERHAHDAHGHDGLGLTDADHVVKLAITLYIQASGGKAVR